jgi:lysine 2,3-aminomutase
MPHNPQAEAAEAVAYLRAHEEVRDVLISGGDPRSCPSRNWTTFGERSIGPHIEFVRIGTGPHAADAL